MQTVLETSIFSRRADALLPREDRARLIGALAGNPLIGDLVPGLGGIRKMRFAPAGRGKSGAFRVIYYFASVGTPILALLIYGKNEQDSITPQQRDVLLALIAGEKQERRNR
jgi:mRNA-degrading endonuclease RelE of RelBE toxin-antitoxin system